MRQEKQYLLEEMRDHFDRYETFMIMKYQGIPANTVNEFRREVGKLGGNVEMLRKRILIKAAESAGCTLKLADLPGHIGIVFAGKDPLEMTKLVFKYSDDTEKGIEVIGGRFEGKMYSGQDVEKLSKLPSMNVMRAEFLSVLEAPLSQTLAVMDALLSSVIYCLDNKSKQ